MSKRPGNLRLKRRLWQEVHGRDTRLPVKCHWCPCLVTFAQATVDHVRPRSEGGGDALDNLVIACDDCNQLRNHWNQTGRW